MSIQLRPHERIKIDGIPWAVERRVTTGFQLIGVGDGQMRVFTDEELVAFLFEGRMDRLHPDIHPDDHRALNPIDRDFIAYRESEREQAQRRSRYLESLFELLGAPPYSKSRLNVVIQQIASKIGDQAPPGVRTLRRWIAAARQAGPDIRAQIPQYFKQGNRTPRFPRVVERIAAEVLEEHLMRPTPTSIKDAYSIFKSKIEIENRINPHAALRSPSLATWYRRAGALDDEERIAAQRGRRAANQTYRPVKKGPVETAPMAAVEIDHTVMDCHIVDETGNIIGRPTLTLALDRATRMCVGFVIGWDPPSFQSVMLVLRHVIQPKTYVHQAFPSIRGEWPCFGVPQTIVIDNGMEFHSTNLQTACDQLGIVIKYTPTKTPHLKGMVERFFGTINNKLLHRLPGAALPIDRGSDYNPADSATLTLGDLNQLLHQFLIDGYSRTFHRGLNDVPVEAWKKGVEVHPLRLPASIKDLDILSCGVAQRTVGRKGIELHSLFYQSPDLAALRIQSKGSLKVDVRYDPTDLGNIWVFNSQTGRHIRVPCITPEHASGRTLWQHKRILEHLGERKRGATAREVEQTTAALHQRIVSFASGRARKRTKERAARFTARPSTPGVLAGFAPANNATASLAEALSPVDNSFAEDHATANSGKQTANAVRELNGSPAAVPAEANSSVDLDEIIKKHGFSARRLQ